ncbi:MAG: type II secretion system protein M [Desulfobacterales bacterium]|nr:type II secretion system protein M [Desulfobacterales bacterium]
MAISLNRREKYSVMGAVIVLCVFILVQFIISPFFDRRERLKRTYASKVKTLQEMIVLKAEFDTFKNIAKQSERQMGIRPGNFKLSSFLNRLADEAGIKDNIDSRKQSTRNQKNSDYKISLVEMRLKSVNMEQLVLFIYKIETAKEMAFIKRISISKTDKKEGRLNVDLQVETLIT